MNVLSSVLSWLGDGYWPSAEEHDDLFVRVRDVGRRYKPLRLVASGDVADVHLAADDSDVAALYLLKVARRCEDNARLDAERRALTTLSRMADDTTYLLYLPALVDSFATAGRRPQRVNVFRFEPGWHTLEQVHRQHPALDGRHPAWVFKRLLTVLGFAHRRRMIHGAVLPSHVLINAADHGLRLVGWGASVPACRPLTTVSARYRPWYPTEVHRRRPAGPATDLFLAARCLVYLAGGDPVTNQMPDDIPLPMRRFIRTCLLPSASMRPQDAWALMAEFDDLLRALYGPPKFHPLTLT